VAPARGGGRRARRSNHRSLPGLTKSKHEEPFSLLVAQLAYEGKGDPDLAYRFERPGEARCIRAPIPTQS
jgi:hypothetical protein